jgi:ferric-dicitrate binding protein FerR (iron transport regulator)
MGPAMEREVSRNEDIKMTRIEKIVASLADEGLSEAQLERVASILSANSPRRAYVWAVVFLGAATYVLSLGAILLRAAPDALWTAVGAGLGGLTGIFMGQHDG